MIKKLTKILSPAFKPKRLQRVFGSSFIKQKQIRKPRKKGGRNSKISRIQQRLENEHIDVSENYYTLQKLKQNIQMLPNFDGKVEIEKKKYFFGNALAFMQGPNSIESCEQFITLFQQKTPKVLVFPEWSNLTAKKLKLGLPEFYKNQEVYMDIDLKESFNKRNIDDFFMKVMPSSRDYFQIMNETCIAQYHKSQQQMSVRLDLTAAFLATNTYELALVQPHPSSLYFFLL